MRPGLRFNASPHLLAAAGSLAQQRRQIPSQSSSEEDLENDGVHRLSTPALLAGAHCFRESSLCMLGFVPAK